ncbi:DUF6274 family protein [Streptomyces sp. NPDC004726]
MAASTARRHETRALLRAHLAAASGYRHRTGRCPVCRQLQRLATEAEPASGTEHGSRPGSGLEYGPGSEPVPEAGSGAASGAGCPDSSEDGSEGGSEAASRAASGAGPEDGSEDEGPDTE